MFRQLKFKLTLINVAVFLVVISFIMTGIFYLMVRSTINQSEEQMRLIAKNAGSLESIPSDIPEKFMPTEFFVKVNGDGKVIETSPNLPVSKNQLKNLISKALNQGETGIIKESDTLEEFRFIKAPLKESPNWVLVFLSTNLERLYTGHLKAALFIITFAGIILTLLCSLFLANKALVPIQNSWESQKNFVGDASHELRTPLTVIQTNLDIVLDSPKDTIESQRVWLENIQIETKLMAKLIDDLLFLARTNSPQALLSMENFSLTELINESINTLKMIAAQKNINLKTSVDPNIELHGDPTKIKQLFTILIDNSIKYTPPGGEVTIYLRGVSRRVQLIVSDTGEGIDREHLDKIFERFYRIDKARSREHGGTGLGLAIADWIVKAHKGTIKIKSVLKKGTTVTVELPN